MYLLSDAITWKVLNYRLQATCPRQAGRMCVAHGIKFFRVLASILEGRGLVKMEPNWPFWPHNFAGSGLLNLLKLKTFPRWCLGGLRA